MSPLGRFAGALLLCLELTCDGQTYSDVWETFEQGMRNYSTYIRPVINQTDAINVSLSWYLMKITAVKESEHTLQTTGFLIVAWVDQIMKQSLTPLCKNSNTCDTLFPTNGTETFSSNFRQNYLLLSADTLWLPDLRIHNARGKFSFNKDEAQLSLYYNGDVLWVPGGQFETLCDMDVRQFPFDKHSCNFDVGPWQSNKQTIISDRNAVDLSYFENDGEWRITTSYLSNASYIIGGCCRYTIEIRRRPEMLVVTMILPTTLLSFIGTLVFLLPTESGERISLAVAVTLALVLYLTIIQNILPHSVSKPAYFEILLCSEVILNSINVIIAVVNIYIYHRGGVFRLKPMSVWVKFLTPNRQHSLIKTETLQASGEAEPKDKMELNDVNCTTQKAKQETIGKGISVENTQSLTRPEISTGSVILVSAETISHVADKVTFVIVFLVNVFVLFIFIIMVAL